MSDNRRMPPQNIEAEMSVVGGILLDNEAMNTVMELLDPEDFYVEAHRKIILAMVDLNEKGQPCDFVTLSSTLREKKQLEKVGGASYLAELVDYVPTSANIAYYCHLVKEKSVARKLLKSVSDISTSVYESNAELGEVLDQAQQIIFEITRERETTTTYPIGKILHDSIMNIEKLYERKERITGVPTGFLDLDEMTAGFQPGNLIVIAGRPSMGKTALAVNIAQFAAVHSHKQVPVLIFSLEMSKEDLVTRMLCSEAKISANRIRTGHLVPDDFPKLMNGASRLNSGPIFIDDTSSISALELRAKARRIKATHGLGLVVVDYLQLMRGNSKAENRNQEIADITRSLKALSKELKVPVVALSQLSRLSAQRPQKDRRPVLSDLRESGAIEQDADVVIFVHREEYYDRENTELKGKAEIIISKQRNGPVDTVHLAFLNEFTQFANLSQRE